MKSNRISFFLPISPTDIANLSSIHCIEVVVLVHVHVFFSKFYLMHYIYKVIYSCVFIYKVSEPIPVQCQPSSTNVPNVHPMSPHPLQPASTTGLFFIWVVKV